MSVEHELNRAIGALEARLQGQEDWIKSVQADVHKIAAKQDTILEALAERRGAERAAMWMVGTAAALAGSTATLWLKKIFGA